MISTTDNILSNINDEVTRQYHKWGKQSYVDGTGPSVRWQIGTEKPATTIERIYRDFCQAQHEFYDQGTWHSIFLEEVSEVMSSEGDNLKEELIQVAAVCVSWLQDIENRNK